MTPQARHQLVEELFHTALNDGDGSIPTSDGELRSDVEALLASYREWSASLPPPAPVPMPRFGPYQCDGILGTGGMGTVYRAHRDDGQYRQQVAIKVLRGSLRSEWFYQKFLAEREILATLNHPHIARLLDGNITAAGDPYLVMEYVEGVALDEYCDGSRMPVAARLELFLKICAPVSFAHQNLVVHRDLKPSNVLITADGEPKLLDFGAARVVNLEAGNATVPLLTPRYASPEQLRAEPANTVSDVYSLGVILYELLTGATPFPGENGLDVAVRRSQGEAAIRPMAEVVTETAAEARSATIRSLQLALRGDLTTIVETALASEPGRRYASVKDFAADVQALREHRPIAARRPSAGYLAGKFIRRNRVATAAAGLLVLAIGTGVLGTLWQARRAERRFNDVHKLAHFLVFDVNEGLRATPGTTALQRLTVERSLTYLDDLSKESVEDAALGLEIAQAYQRLGDVLGNPFSPSLGNRTAAGAAYEKGMKVLRALPETRATRLTGAAIRLQRGATQAFGATERAGLDAMREAIGELRTLVREDPADLTTRVALAQGLTFLAGRAAAGGGMVEAAAQPGVANYFAESLEHLQEALRQAPADTGALTALAQRELGAGLLEGSTEPVAAAARYRQGLRWLDQIRPEAQIRHDIRRVRASLLGNIGWAEGQSGDRAEAIRSFGEAIALHRAWTEADPGDSTGLYQFTSMLRGRGIVYSYEKMYVQAAADFQAAAAIHARLAAADPPNAVYKFLRAELLIRSANMLTEGLQPAEARRAGTEGLRIMASLGESPKATLSHIFGVCRWFTEIAIPDLREPARAAKFCRLAAEKTGRKDPDAFEGLAAALDQMGDAPGAAEAAETAIGLIPPTKPGEPPSQQRLNFEAALRRYRAQR